MTEPATIRYYLIALTAEDPNDEPPLGTVLAQSMRDAMAAVGLVPLEAKAYSAPYAVDPETGGLREAWNRLDNGQRQALGFAYPELAAAVLLMCG